jgi:CRISPR-associated protein Cmr2
MSRDFLSEQLGKGVLAELIRQIWKAEAERAQLQNQLKRLPKWNKSKQLKQCIKRIENQIVEKLAPQLWQAVLNAAPRWPAWNNLAATVYQALDSVGEGAKAPDAFRQRWMERVHKELARDEQSYLRQEIERWDLRDFWEGVQELSLSTDPPLLPSHWFIIQFRFRLAKPYLSQDDDPVYIIDNPVRKDKVFKVPMVAPSSWKGKLRWVATKFLADQADTLSDEEFAQRRMQLTLLFGDEKGEEPGEIKELAKYLDEAKAKRSAKELYRRKVKEYFGVDLDKPLPHHAGRLYLYPTFFDRIDLEVINPHDRRTKAGTKPIYFESVPIGAKGTFTLLYVPFDLIGRPGDHRKEVADDLETVAGAVQAMMLTYGFGAKTTSGFGVAEDALVGAGKLVIERKTYSFNSLSQLTTKAQEAASALRQGGAE